jgi:glycogen(starch) synthase
MNDSAFKNLSVCVFTRAWQSSGAGLFAQELVNGMLDAGAAITFVSPLVENAQFELPRKGLTRIRQSRERDARSSPIARVYASVARIVGSAAGLAKARRKNRIFIVTIPDPLIFSVPMLAILRLSGARIIFIAHDPTPHSWRLPAPLRSLEMTTHAACYHLADTVVVLSAPTRERLRSVFPAVKCPIEVIEHGVFAVAGTQPLPGDGQLLLFGTLRRNKGIFEAIGGVISAQARGVPVRLVVAGAVHREDAAYAEDCAALARSAGSVVDLRTGHVSDEELGVLINESDALLLPYTSFDSQSGVALLAASNARPIIASMAGGIGALIDEGMPATVVASPVSSASVDAGIAAFFETAPEDWRARCERYRVFTAEHRSWPVIGRHYLELAAKLNA